MSNPIKVLFALLLMFALVFQGCAAHAPRPASGPDAGGLVKADAQDAPGDGLQQTSSGGEKVAAFFLVGLLLVTVVTIDLLLLPATYHDPFPCCRSVITICN
jgi:hypothetical protein